MRLLVRETLTTLRRCRGRVPFGATSSLSGVETTSSTSDLTTAGVASYATLRGGHGGRFPGRGWSATPGCPGLVATTARRSYAKDFYDTLGVNRGASKGDIKKAYLQKAKELHPDTNTDDPDAASKFQDVQKAYEVLKDDEKKRVYDQVGADAYESYESGGGSAGAGGFGGGPGGFGFEQGPFGFHFRQGGQGDINLDDIFSEFFGSQMGQDPFGSRRRRRGQNLAVEMAVSFTEAAFGCTKTIAVDVPVEHLARGSRSRSVRTERKEVDISIPAGVDDNETLRVRGEGSPGPEGANPGDLMVYLRVMPHPQFTRSGHNININVEINVIQAILGGNVRIPTLDEGDLQLKVRPGTQPEEMQVIKGKGIPILGARSVRSRGNMYVKFKVSTPNSALLTERQRELLEEFQEIEENRGGDNTRRSSGS
ncbi:DnaJ-like protein [Chloropicon primus]|uniref:DnaJ-like protein n=1 Tax=Chloropicon primus TaxID=1764295 RepID=A0A5B8MVZ4_9CHLO|nr:DnaJ-like protein [Chloropicon primus]UPR02998.1 DnaJ-like protein [Chloropicon primus]|eukprot:QDZ23785.1 DnaJ-like protein [Chloropicon primus]